MSSSNNRSIIHCCVERSVYELLIEHCKATGQTKTTAVKRAIMAYCGNVLDGSKGAEDQGGVKHG